MPVLVEDIASPRPHGEAMRQPEYYSTGYGEAGYSFNVGELGLGANRCRTSGNISGVIADEPHSDWQYRIESSTKLAKTSADLSGLRQALNRRGERSEPFRLQESVDTKKFEEFYNKIGWWIGPNATPEVRGSVLNFWSRKGPVGAAWLIKRVATETHVDLLDGVANLLSDLGPTCINPIVDALNSSRASRNQAEVLLKALGWIEASPYAANVGKDYLETALERYLEHPDSDVREAACTATRHLPRSQALALLASRAPLESDPDVVAAIHDAID